MSPQLRALSLFSLLGLAACSGTPRVNGLEGVPTTSGATTGKPDKSGGDGLIPNIPIGSATQARDSGVPATCVGDNCYYTSEDAGPACGDGEITTGEECDDGNSVPGDGCNGACQQEPYFECNTPGEACTSTIVCGDGVRGPGEVCDDGNTESGDGCSKDCVTQETDYVCAKEGEACKLLYACGDGRVSRDEKCDDGNTESGDGCDENCQPEDGYSCRLPGKPCKANPNCPNGQLDDGEECDDGNTTWGDGCSGECTIDPFYECLDPGSPCTSTIVCGDAQRDPGEVCDDGNQDNGDGCNQTCTVQDPAFVCPVGKACKQLYRCGDGAVSQGAGETCEDGNVMSLDGCSGTCQIETGYVCPVPGNACMLRTFCGDHIVNGTEQCDDGGTAAGDGCSPSCRLEKGWTCNSSGCTYNVVCGDGIRDGAEECDDKNKVAGDGCNASCKLESGWVCPLQATPCVPKCGDGILKGGELCDDGNTASSDGCTAGCQREPNYDCPTPGVLCTLAVCGDAAPSNGNMTLAKQNAKGDEGCDDGNIIAGDGCGPKCQIEPEFDTTRNASNPGGNYGDHCGDGLITGTEACDDGNTQAGDGCSATTCQVETGFTCSPLAAAQAYPSTVAMRVTYRDFKGKTSTGSHAQFEKDNFGANPGIAGPVCTTANQGTCGKLATSVVTDGPPIGKPTKAAGTFTSMPAGNGRTAEALFSLWYSDSDAITGTNHVDIERVNSTLGLTQQGAGQNVYAYDSAAFYPLNGDGTGANDGFGNSCPMFSSTTACCTSDPDGAGTDQEQCSNRNYHFTTELRYFFQYKGGETLTFRGDDDVFVFINGRLAVDIGGVHQAYVGRVVLGDEDSSCSIQGGSATTAAPAACTTYTNPTETNDPTDDRFGITKNGVYEIAFFQAERRTSISSFRLTLAGFLSPRSNCTPICGDGKVVRGEVCDDGTVGIAQPPFDAPPNNANGVYGACNLTCSARTFCGDKHVDTPNETCDNGINDDIWAATTTGFCAPGCKPPSYCGDNIVDAATGGEECDLGGGNTNSGYGGCTKQCKRGPYCGDAHLDAPNETCDDGKNDNRYGGCTADCKPAARCGDGLVQADWGEDCDGTPDCGSNCLFLGSCGDGIQQVDEQCDDGKNTGQYGRCAPGCVLGPRCGDGIAQTNEQCDEGVALNVGGYNGCDSHCSFGPRCGDGSIDTSSGETCDDGVNDNTYGSCTADCQAGPSCGDGKVQEEWGEECDGEDDCTKECRLGALCGNKHKDKGEECDDGVNNGGYGECAPGCVLGPNCGDGIRNGKEQCDDGKNLGGYGKCAPGCKLGSRCGDGLVDPANGEQCDDGNTTSHDGCSSSCRREIVKQG